jgi:hypothetical protein
MSNKNVHIEEIDKVRLPSVVSMEDRGAEFCKTPIRAVATLSSVDLDKNSRLGLAYKFDSIDVYLERKSDGVTIPAPGIAVTFPNQSDACGFVIDWRQVTKTVGPLTTLAVDCYRVKVNYTKGTAAGTFYECSIDLREYNNFNTEGFVNLFVVLNDLVKDHGINYKDSGFASTLMFRGQFGYMQPNYVTTNNIYSGDSSRRKVDIKSIKTFELRTNHLLSCVTQQLDEDYLLAANQIYITDWNANNHIQGKYVNFPLIISQEESPSFEYDTGVYAKMKVIFNKKQQLHESKYSGDIKGSDNIILELPTLIGSQVNAIVRNTVPTTLGTVAGGGTFTVSDSPITLNSVTFLDVPAEVTQDIVLQDQNSDPIVPASLIGNIISVNIPVESDAWVRNLDWLAMPTVNLGDDKFAGLYAVYEGTSNELIIAVGGSGGSEIFWGDGASQVTTNLTEYTKSYDYASTTGTVSIDAFGRNYKQVIVEITLVGSIGNLYTDRDSSSINYPLGWLDIIADIPDVTNFQFSQQRKSTVLERIVILDSSMTSTNSTFQNTNSLRVWDVVLGATGNLQSTFLYGGDMRDENNGPLTMTSTTITQMNSTFQSSKMTKYGEINSPSMTQLFGTFNNVESLLELGNITGSALTNIRSVCNGCISLYSDITVTSSTALDTVRDAFSSCRNLQGLEITDMTSVTTTYQMLLNCQSLTRCILTGLKYAVDVKDARMSTSALDALMTSLGTTIGTQTLNISGNPGSSTCDPTIATVKGWTVIIS